MPFIDCPKEACTGSWHAPLTEDPRTGKPVVDELIPIEEHSCNLHLDEKEERLIHTLAYKKAKQRRDEAMIESRAEVLL